MTSQVFAGRPSDARTAALVEAASPRVFWTDRPGCPTFDQTLTGRLDADLVIVGGGFTGLWAALAAKGRDPARSIVVLEAETIGHGASGRNGGFCDASLTHGLENGVSQWPNEMETLLRLGDDNLQGLLADLERLGLGHLARPTEALWVAVADWQLEDLEQGMELQRRYGRAASLLDRAEMTARVQSPIYLGGLAIGESLALIDPAQLAWGLGEAVAALGVRIHERSAATDITADPRSITVRTEQGSVVADRVIVATNAWAGPARSMARRVLPVYDHVLVTEPLSAQQMDSIGWRGREGLSDAGNQFHYYRLTDDDRILWGGFDANYHFGSRVRARHEVGQASHQLLAEHFFQTFPQLESLGFTHRWAGPIGTTSRFTSAWGQEHDGRLVWVGGYTGLGVGASRFGAGVALDLVNGERTERTELDMVRSKPFPFPPEPLRWPAVQLTRRAILRSDRRQGRRGPWLRLLDRFGIGFDS